MALEVTVGPPVLTINNGHTFLVSELDGTITPASDQGLYSADTRYLSGYQLFINGKSWTLLNSGAMAYYASQTHLVNPMVVTEEGVIAPGTLGLLLSRTLGEALHEDLDIRNYSGKHLHFILEVLMRSAGEIVSRTSLVERVWDEASEVLDNLVDVHLSHLRKKIDLGDRPPLIHTIRGFGYRLGRAQPTDA